MSGDGQAFSDSLARLERQARGLRPCWHDPGRFYDQRDEVVHSLRTLASEASPSIVARSTEHRLAASQPCLAPERERRMWVLLTHQSQELIKLRHLLAAAVHHVHRRRRVVDERQLDLLQSETRR